MQGRCIAYLESGAVCGAPASILDPQRGGLVCPDHAPAGQLVAGDGGRLALGGRDLSISDHLELLVAGEWVPARVEWTERLGWYAAVCQQPGDGGTLAVVLRIGNLARLLS